MATARNREPLGARCSMRRGSGAVVGRSSHRVIESSSHRVIEPSICRIHLRSLSIDVHLLSRNDESRFESRFGSSRSSQRAAFDTKRRRLRRTVFDSCSRRRRCAAADSHGTPFRYAAISSTRAAPLAPQFTRGLPRRRAPLGIRRFSGRKERRPNAQRANRAVRESALAEARPRMNARRPAFGLIASHASRRRAVESVRAHFPFMFTLCLAMKHTSNHSDPSGAPPSARRAASDSSRLVRGMRSPQRGGAALALAVASLAGCGGGDSGEPAPREFAPPTVQLAYPTQPNSPVAPAPTAHVSSGHTPPATAPAAMPTASPTATPTASPTATPTASPTATAAASPSAPSTATPNAPPAAPPAVVATRVPPTHAALRRPTIELEFDRAIEPGSVPHIALRADNGTSVAVGPLSWLSDRRIAFAPRKPLKSNSRYEIMVPAGIRSTTGERSTHPLTSSFDTAPVTPPRGLPNLDGASCFINTALQLAVHSSALDDILSNEAVPPAVRTLLEDYDAASADALDAQLAAAVAALRERLRIPGGEAGPVQEALKEMGMPLHETFDVSDIHSAPAGTKAFILNSSYDYAALPNHDRLVAFSYYTGGHYLAYVKRDGIWYSVDDARVSEVSEQQLRDLTPLFHHPTNSDVSGAAIEIAIYR
ncbi:Ig-like domain-containing protein [Burkholderia pseudomallei]|nr:Ig-like domain-containing protein [Burkholderia pseudomallei]MBY7655270.1 Ig-like domain-containing protein [Burkholderia pseudomallei]QUN84832.1 Ig-like domain-containing protein [Burkholderia pseudomallei]QUO00555.1 Ig-like domain-containing protein [Burkholderia pseudomallei]QUO07126.1 Ig-like domain-containing protein [Burkholderia pseudomallei]QUO12866.1 Ig-like domain-containing protein [Burkholderia pseudomallei]